MNRCEECLKAILAQGKVLETMARDLHAVRADMDLLVLDKREVHTEITTLQQRTNRISDFVRSLGRGDPEPEPAT